MKNGMRAGWRVGAACCALCLIAAAGLGAENRFPEGAFARRVEHSELWGKNGEKWSPESRLPDFSYAGYHCGEAPLPNVPRGVSVKDFGAKGDGVADDTQAFLDALAKAPTGAIEVPAGRYKITKILELNRSGIVLRGEGPMKSVLYFPITLTDVKPDWGATSEGARTSNYSWSGGFVWFRAPAARTVSVNVSSEAKRGDRAVRVETTKDFKPETRILISQRDPGDKSLINYLYAGDPGDTKNLKSARAEMVCRVTKVEGGTVYFDRPLRFDVKPAWRARVGLFTPSVTESGVENLGFEYPNTPYKGHFTELGFNAIAMGRVAADCWVRNIRIMNSDSGLFLGGNFCTVQGVTLESARAVEKERKATGHHGIELEGDDNLVTDFYFRTRFMHEFTVQGAAGNVFAGGEGVVDICFDHHKQAPYANLFTDITVGDGTRLWQCGGGAALGKNSGAWETFWNIRARRGLKYPPASFGPAAMNLVGLTTAPGTAAVKEMQGKWFETIKTEELEPKDLHAAQLAKRMENIRKSHWGEESEVGWND